MATANNMIGPYQIIKSLGSGGMGEVLLAYDSSLNRYIAIKTIRPDLVADQVARARILREAQITSHLTHPAIIPIYSVSADSDPIYFTMAYIEGKSLKDLINEALEKGTNDLSTSVSFLSHIFLKVCRAIDYAHTQGIYHRDIKPSNIMIGPSGSAYILDWGVAQVIPAEPAKRTESLPEHVAGTTQYLAPERTLGCPADQQTEVYALGLLLYQILTLRYPFHRSSLEEFRENVKQEVVTNPCIVAPHRNIPPILSHIAQKCLSNNPEMRYQTVNDIIHDLQVCLEGSLDWVKTNTFDFNDKASWKKVDKSFILQHPIPDICKIECTLKAASKESRIGFFFTLPSETTSPFYFTLDKDQTHRITIELSSTSTCYYLDNQLQHVETSHFPKVGPAYFGVMLDHGPFTQSEISLFINNESLQTNPLNTPNVYAARKEYTEALKEYQLICQTYPDTLESYEAIFRSGIILLREEKTQAALAMFSKLHATASAPLEYLGKAIAYQQLQDENREIDSLEQGFLHFSTHVRLPDLLRHLHCRFLDGTIKEPMLLYRFALLVCRYLPETLITPDLELKLDQIEKELPREYFIDDKEVLTWPKPDQRLSLAMRLSFELKQTNILLSLLKKALLKPPSSLPLIEIALYGLIELNGWEEALNVLNELFDTTLDVQAVAHLEWLQAVILAHQRKFIDIPHQLLSEIPPQLDKNSLRPFFLLFNKAIDQGITSPIHSLVPLLTKHTLEEEQRIELNCYRIWAYLLESNWSQAEQILKEYPPKSLKDENSELSFLYTCWLAATKKKQPKSPHKRRNGRSLELLKHCTQT